MQSKFAEILHKLFNIESSGFFVKMWQSIIFIVNYKKILNSCREKNSLCWGWQDTLLEAHEKSRGLVTT